jgi:SAM-dependent methyltransferase
VKWVYTVLSYELLLKFVQNLILSLKIMTKVYNIEKSMTCPLCDGSDFKRYAHKREGLICIKLEQCDKCGLVIQSPRLTNESLKQYYTYEYRLDIKKKNIKKIEPLFQRGIRRGKYISQYLIDHEIDIVNKAVYEIGCGYGGILAYFSSMGCQVGGCDLSPTSVEYGKHKGLALENGDIQCFINLSVTPDIIILSHVLEHISSPLTFLNNIKKKIKKGSILYIEIPGLNNPQIRLTRSIQIGHLMYFNLDTLRAMAESVGFNFLYGNEVVQAVFKNGK